MHHSAAPGQIGIVFPVTLGVTGSTRSFIAGLIERAVQSELRKCVGGCREGPHRVGNRAAGCRALDAGRYSRSWSRTRSAKRCRRTGPGGRRGERAASTCAATSSSYEPGTFMCIDDWASVGRLVPIALGVKLARPTARVMLRVRRHGRDVQHRRARDRHAREHSGRVRRLQRPGLGNERAFQNEHYGGRFYAVDYNDPDFGALAKCSARTVNMYPPGRTGRCAHARLRERQTGHRRRDDRSAHAGTGGIQIMAAISVPVAISISTQQPSRSSHA